MVEDVLEYNLKDVVSQLIDMSLAIKCDIEKR